MRWGGCANTGRRLAIAGVLAVLLPAGLAGCFGPEQRGFDSPSPNRRIDAIAESAKSDDQRSLQALVVALESPDAAERMLAIRALEAREGTTLGYRHDDPHWVRREAVDRWWAKLDGATTENTPDPDDSQDQGASGTSGVRIAPAAAFGQRALRSDGAEMDLGAGWAPEDVNG